MSKKRSVHVALGARRCEIRSTRVAESHRGETHRPARWRCMRSDDALLRKREHATRPRELRRPNKRDLIREDADARGDGRAGSHSGSHSDSDSEGKFSLRSNHAAVRAHWLELIERVLRFFPLSVLSHTHMSTLNCLGMSLARPPQPPAPRRLPPAQPPTTHPPPPPRPSWQVASRVPRRPRRDACRGARG